ncbi:response regulator transcription factor [Symbioplanes lichenis]|uniref:response regulator transcription factor n=1 Tax=Symbioplanes lichenis TaxID=1629072 RepID=UPI00273977C6|nr:response regulator transcription factor [Actinoplanes lichenis]
MIRVLIVSQLRLLRESLQAVLGGTGGVEPLLTDSSGDELLRVVREVRPRVALVDIDEPGGAGPPGSGLRAAELLTREAAGTEVVTLTAQRTPGRLREAMLAGVRGFATRDQAPGELAELIRRVAAGERVIDPDTAVAALHTVDNPLTEREQDVLRLTLVGLSTRLIARQLHLSSGTVRNYLSGAVRKLGCTNRLQAAARSMDSGWL